MKSNDAREQFVRYITANLRYWLKRTENLPQLDLIQLDADRQNIYQAVQFGLAYPQTWPETAQLLIQASLFIVRRGYWREWIPLLTEATAKCGENDPAIKGRLLNSLGHSQRLDRQWSEAIASHREAQAIAKNINDDFLAAQSTHFLCAVFLHNRQYPEAERYGLAALEAFRRIDPSSSLIAQTLNDLAQIARWRGDFETAGQRYATAIAQMRQFNDLSNLGTTFSNMAENLQAAGRLDEALSYYQEAIPMLEKAGNHDVLVDTQINLGALYYRKKEYALAEKAFRQIDLSYSRRVGDVFHQAQVAQNLGNVILLQGRLETAELYLRQSHELWLQLGDEINLANTLGTLAETAVARGNAGEAIPLYDEALRLLKDYPDHAWARKLLGEFSEARQELRSS